MKFSVKNLLAVTLLVALTINGCNTLNKAAELGKEKESLTTSLPGLRNATRSFEEQKLIYDRAFEASQIRKRNFESYWREFERLVEENSQLKITDPSKIFVKEIPAHQPELGNLVRFRIWLPESHQFHLQVHSERFTIAAGKSPAKGKFFHPPKSKMFPLEAGESVVQVNWTKESKQSRIQLFVNDKLMHEAIHPRQLTWGKPFGRVRPVQRSWTVETSALVGNSYNTDDETVLLLFVADK